MKAIKQLTLLFSLLILTSSLCAQSGKRLKAFSDDNTTYIEELNTFMLSGSSSEDTKKMMKKFTKSWEGKTFSSDKKATIIEVSNKM